MIVPKYADTLSLSCLWNWEDLPEMSWGTTEFSWKLLSSVFLKRTWQTLLMQCQQLLTPGYYYPDNLIIKPNQEVKNVVFLNYPCYIKQ